VAQAFVGYFIPIFTGALQLPLPRGVTTSITAIAAVEDWISLRPSAIVSGSQHLPEGAAPPQRDLHLLWGGETAATFMTDRHRIEQPAKAAPHSSAPRATAHTASPRWGLTHPDA
jgi:hypothetical protein